MSLIKELATLLQNHGFGTVYNPTTQTGNIFVEEIPANPSDLIMILQNVSPQPDQELNTKTLNFDVITRNQNTGNGGDIAEAIIEAIHRTQHIDLGHYHINYIGALGDVENQGKDIDRRSLHRVAFRAIYIDNRTVS